MSRLTHFIIATAAVVFSSSLLWGTSVAANPINIPNGTVNFEPQVADLIGPNSQSAACNAVSLGTSSTCPTNSDDKVNTLIKDAVNILSIVVGIVAVIMIVVGGFKFITSGGEASKAAAARSTIIYALIGMLIAVLAQVIVHFVLNRAANA